MMNDYNCSLSCYALARMVNSKQLVNFISIEKVIPFRNLNIANEMIHIQNKLKQSKVQFRIFECKRIKVNIHL